VAHVCNSSYSRGRDQGIVVRSQPGQIVPRPYLEKNPSQKRVGGVAQGVGPGFKAQYCKKNNKKVELRFGSGGKSLHPSSGSISWNSAKGAATRGSTESLEWWPGLCAQQNPFLWGSCMSYMESAGD
jgi:hypothetical protein